MSRVWPGWGRGVFAVFSSILRPSKKETHLKNQGLAVLIARVVGLLQYLEPLLMHEIGQCALCCFILLQHETFHETGPSHPCKPKLLQTAYDSVDECIPARRLLMNISLSTV